jgi:hypothetical protein
LCWVFLTQSLENYLPGTNFELRSSLSLFPKWLGLQARAKGSRLFSYYHLKFSLERIVDLHAVARHCVEALCAFHPFSPSYSILNHCSL